MSSNVTMMLVSKEHIRSVKQLYKLIFKLHKSLPDDMRLIGDSYVRNEFKLHKNAAPEYATKFLNEWTNYAITLGKQLNPKYKSKLGLQLNEELIDNFNDDQIQQLYELFKEIKQIDK